MWRQTSLTSIMPWKAVGDLTLLTSTELVYLSNILLEKKTTAQIEKEISVLWKSHETHRAAKTPERLPSLLSLWVYRYGFWEHLLIMTIWK